MRLMDLIVELETMETNADLTKDIKGIKNDSKKVGEGDAFVAISGSSKDGHVFLQEALRNGADVVVSEKPLSNSIPYIVVPSTKVALSKLASAINYHPSRKMKMIGVTGTNGKTTTTHIIYELLKSAGHLPSIIGTNHILIGNKELSAERTTPDAVSLHSLFAEMLTTGCTHCVMEVSSHALSQFRVAGIQYDIGVFTNLSQDHLDYHHDMESYFNDKRLLFSQCNSAVINIDDEYGRRLYDSLIEARGLSEQERHKKSVPSEIFSISTKNDNADFFADRICLRNDSVVFDTVNNGQRERLIWNTPGQFSVYNALTAIACGQICGLSLKAMSETLTSAPPVLGRMEQVKTAYDFTVLIDYAHTPDALENVLKTLRTETENKVICVFGCGGDRDKSKRSIMGKIAEKYADVLIVTSDNPRTESPDDIIDDIFQGITGLKETFREQDREKAIHKAMQTAASGDIIIICGKGHEMYQEINGVKHPMDERQIILSFEGD